MKGSGIDIGIGIGIGMDIQNNEADSFLMWLEQSTNGQEITDW